MTTPLPKILHLSDLHFGAPDRKGHYWNSEATELELPEHDRRGLLGSLVRDIEHTAPNPDLVIVTGDLLDRGSNAGVAMAVQFLTGLYRKLRLRDRRRVVLLPGNHDVLREGAPEARYALFDEVWRGFYGRKLPIRPETPPHRRVRRFDFAADLGVEVVAFNSCEALDAAMGQDHGSVGTAQRDRAEALLKATADRGLFRIAAMHHHLVSPAGVVRNDYSVMDDAGLTLQWLAEHKFHLALHGHQHVDWNENREHDGWRIEIAAASSAGVASYGRNQWMLQLGYQIIVVDSASQGRRIRREYDPQSRKWIEASKVAAERELRFGPILQGRGDAPSQRRSDIVPRDAPAEFVRRQQAETETRASGSEPADERNNRESWRSKLLKIFAVAAGAVAVFGFTLVLCQRVWGIQFDRWLAALVLTSATLITLCWMDKSFKVLGAIALAFLGDIRSASAATPSASAGAPGILLAKFITSIVTGIAALIIPLPSDPQPPLPPPGPVRPVEKQIVPGPQNPVTPHQEPTPVTITVHLPEQMKSIDCSQPDRSDQFSIGEEQDQTEITILPGDYTCKAVCKTGSGGADDRSGGVEFSIDVSPFGQMSPSLEKASPCGTTSP